MTSRLFCLALALVFSLPVCSAAKSQPTQVPVNASSSIQQRVHILRSEYEDKLHGFWLGQSIANWTGLVTEMDKIGGEGIHGQFYTRHDWGGPDQPSIWGQGIPSQLSSHIDFVLRTGNEPWGADDDTDIEYMYQYLLHKHANTMLTPAQIRQGWLQHIYADAETPFKTGDGKPENYLWVSNQRAFELMQNQKLMPPDTSSPKVNPHYDMIDAQLSTEIFGLFAPYHPDKALALAYLPIRTVARDNAAWAAEFYVIMHALAAGIDKHKEVFTQLKNSAQIARQHLPPNSYSAAMYDWVLSQYKQDKPWEQVRDQLYQRYQVEQQDGYDISSRNLYCNGCFASGINFGASLISLFYGQGDFKQTVKLATLMGWDSDNPAATWGGLLGFIYGKQAIEKLFDKPLSNKFYIHRTRKNFPNKGLDTFENMAKVGAEVTAKVITQELKGQISEDGQIWWLPKR